MRGGCKIAYERRLLQTFSSPFQIGIVLASATIITGMIVLVWISGLLTLAGIVMTTLGVYSPHLLHLH